MVLVDADFLALESGRDKSRLLYTNPVCFLVTRAHDIEVEAWPPGSKDPASPAPTMTCHGAPFNVMTISWYVVTVDYSRRHLPTTITASPSASHQVDVH